MRMTWVWVAVIAVVQCGAATVTFGDLLAQLTDLEVLTTLPSPAYTNKQFSSYDRASTDPSDLSDTNWFANRDRGHHLRTEERNGATEWVMMDAEGPGAIVRIWSANPDDAGIVRIYLDHAETPAIAMPLTDLLRGEIFPFLGPLAGRRASGWNSHLPIPYAKHCKVTASQPNFYYHVNYRTYEPGTQVETYTAAAAESHRGAIEAAANMLASLESRPLPEGATQQQFQAPLFPGDTYEHELTEPGAIYALTARIHAEDVPAALRACWLEIAFDGEGAPSVAAPLGDFFGTAPGLNTFTSLPLAVQSSGEMRSDWVMPYRERAVIRVTNHSPQDVDVKLVAYTKPRPWTDDSLYFNAAWRAEFGIKTKPRQDWNYITIDGAGRFVGDMLQVSNPSPAWWGEGDEKIYVDRETFPSTFGTGSEDYYGYAWCSPELFTHAYHNQPRCDGPGNYGYTNVSRFHVIDDIPFTEAFQFDIEVWHSADVYVDMAATSYWYATRASTDNRPKLDTALLRFDPLPPVPGVEGAIEAEGMEVVSVSAGGTSVQQAVPWSRGSQLWWTQGREGATLVLRFPVEEAGTYAVNTVLTRARDYGIVTIAVNDDAASEPIDLYNPDVVVTPEIDLGTHELKAGANTITVTITGTNPAAVPAYMFGIDYVKLTPN